MTTTSGLISRCDAAFNAKDFACMARCAAHDINHFVNEGDKRGYRKLEGLVTHLAWPAQRGGPDELHPMGCRVRKF